MMFTSKAVLIGGLALIALGGCVPSPSEEGIEETFDETLEESMLEETNEAVGSNETTTATRSLTRASTDTLTLELQSSKKGQEGDRTFFTLDYTLSNHTDTELNPAEQIHAFTAEGDPLDLELDGVRLPPLTERNVTSVIAVGDALFMDIHVTPLIAGEGTTASLFLPID